MDILGRLACSGIVPVVVLEDAGKAVPTARALLDGGISVMEITFRTAAAEDSIRAVSENCPEILVGAGTVVTLEQCKAAAAAGARFIVAPGFDAEVVGWCVEHQIAVVPGCVTPTEIMAAMKFGLKVLKFFPANVYGGLTAMKSLAGPFGGISFIPTGGVNTQNIGEYAAAPYVHAVGGSWVCGKADISAGHFEHITAMCREARKNLLGFEIAHVGINTDGADTSMAVCREFERAFGFTVKAGNSSNFSSATIEVMKSRYLGENGHLAVRTNSMACAVAELEKCGYSVDMETAKFKGEKMTAVYLKEEIGGFAIHLLQK